MAKEYHEYNVRVDGEVFKLRLKGERTSRRWEVLLDGRFYEVITPEFAYYRRRLVLKINGVSHMFRMQYCDNHIMAFYNGVIRTLEIYTPAEWSLTQYMLRDKQAAADNELRCPMPGLLTAVYVAEGDYVRKGQELIRMESMKMESGIASPCDAQVDKVLVQAGQTVESGETLIVFRAP